MKILSVCFLAVAGDMQEIDAQIEQLKAQQEKYASDADKQAHDAMRWQFQSENYMDARRAWDRVASDKQKIKEIQDQIDQLEAEKQKTVNGK